MNADVMDVDVVMVHGDANVREPADPAPVRTTAFSAQNTRGTLARDKIAQIVDTDPSDRETIWALTETKYKGEPGKFLGNSRTFIVRCSGDAEREAGSGVALLFPRSFAHRLAPLDPNLQYDGYVIAERIVRGGQPDLVVAAVYYAHDNAVREKIVSCIRRLLRHARAKHYAVMIMGDLNVAGMDLECRPEEINPALEPNERALVAALNEFRMRDAGHILRAPGARTPGTFYPGGVEGNCLDYILVDELAQPQLRKWMVSPELTQVVDALTDHAEVRVYLELGLNDDDRAAAYREAIESTARQVLNHKKAATEQWAAYEVAVTEALRARPELTGSQEELTTLSVSDMADAFARILLECAKAHLPFKTQGGLRELVQDVVQKRYIAAMRRLRKLARRIKKRQQNAGGPVPYWELREWLRQACDQELTPVLQEGAAHIYELDAAYGIVIELIAEHQHAHDDQERIATLERINYYQEKRAEQFALDPHAVADAVLDRRAGPLDMTRAALPADEDGVHTITAEPDEVKQVLAAQAREFFSAQGEFNLNGAPEWEPYYRRPRHITEDVPNLASPPTRDEVQTIVKGLKANTAPGPDEVSPALLKRGGPQVIVALTNLLSRVYTDRVYPEKWKTGNIYYIPKKSGAFSGKLLDARPITLLCVPSKIFNKVWNSRYVRWAMEKNAIQGANLSVLPGTSTDAPIAAFRNFLAECKLNGSEGYAYSDDKSKAFDTVPYEAIRRTLVRGGMPVDFVDFYVDQVLADRTVRIITGFGLTEEVRVGRGLPQGGVESPLLWTLLYDPLLCRLKEDERFCGKMLRVVLPTAPIGMPHAAEAIMEEILKGASFVDDLILYAGSLPTLRIGVRIVESFSRLNLLVSNMSKAIIMAVNPRTNVSGGIEFANLGPNGGAVTVKVAGLNESVRVLGAFFSAAFDGKAAIRSIETVCTSILAKLKRKMLSGDMVVHVVNSILIPAMVYRTKGWIPTPRECNDLDAKIRGTVRSKMRLMRSCPTALLHDDGTMRLKSFKAAVYEQVVADLVNGLRDEGMFGKMMRMSLASLQKRMQIPFLPVSRLDGPPIKGRHIHWLAGAILLLRENKTTIGPTPLYPTIPGMALPIAACIPYTTKTEKARISLAKRGILTLPQIIPSRANQHVDELASAIPWTSAKCVSTSNAGSFAAYETIKEAIAHESPHSAADPYGAIPDSYHVHGMQVAENPNVSVWTRARGWFPRNPLPFTEIKAGTLWVFPRPGAGGAPRAEREADLYLGRLRTFGQMGGKAYLLLAHLVADAAGTYKFEEDCDCLGVRTNRLAHNGGCTWWIPFEECRPALQLMGDATLSYAARLTGGTYSDEPRQVGTVAHHWPVPVTARMIVQVQLRPNHPLAAFLFVLSCTGKPGKRNIPVPKLSLAAAPEPAALLPSDPQPEWTIPPLVEPLITKTLLGSVPRPASVEVPVRDIQQSIRYPRRSNGETLPLPMHLPPAEGSTAARRIECWSDGSVVPAEQGGVLNEPSATAAVVFHTEDPNSLLVLSAKCPPGPPHSYYAELFGVILAASAVPPNTHLIVRLDNQSVVTASKTILGNSVTTNSLNRVCCPVEWDALRQIVRARRLQLELRWVRGHADCVENHVADAIAGATHRRRRAAMSAKLIAALTIPIVRIQGVGISMDPRRLARAVTGVRMRKRLGRSIAEGLEGIIDYESTLAALHGKLGRKDKMAWSTPHMNALKAFRLKILTDALPTMTHKHHYFPKKYPSPTCPLDCGAPFDDAYHAFACPRNEDAEIVPAGMADTITDRIILKLEPRSVGRDHRWHDVHRRVQVTLTALTEVNPLHLTAGAIATTDIRDRIASLFTQQEGHHHRPESKITALLAACLHALSDSLRTAIWLPRCTAVAAVGGGLVEDNDVIMGEAPRPQQPRAQRRKDPRLRNHCPCCFEILDSDACCYNHVDTGNDMLAFMDIIKAFTGSESDALISYHEPERIRMENERWV